MRPFPFGPAAAGAGRFLFGTLPKKIVACDDMSRGAVFFFFFFTIIFQNFQIYFEMT